MVVVDVGTGRASTNQLKDRPEKLQCFPTVPEVCRNHDWRGSMLPAEVTCRGFWQASILSPSTTHS